MGRIGVLFVNGCGLGVGILGILTGGRVGKVRGDLNRDLWEVCFDDLFFIILEK